MLTASDDTVYVNEPMNPSHPPGRSPGVFNAEVARYFEYICAENGGHWHAAFAETLALRYHPIAELRANRSFYDVAKAARNTARFTAAAFGGARR